MSGLDEYRFISSFVKNTLHLITGACKARRETAREIPVAQDSSQSSSVLGGQPAITIERATVDAHAHE